MKTIIIKAVVPDDFPEEMVIYSCEIQGREDKNYHEYDRFHSCDDAEIITLPTEAEIGIQAEFFTVIEKEDGFQDGANWVINKIKSQ